jgi:hypothetical protein
MKRIFFFLFFLFNYCSIFSQYEDEVLEEKYKEFILECPLSPSETSLYNEIEIIDSRYDTTQLGIVQLGMFNRKARLLAKKPLDIQIKNAFKSILPSTPNAGKLIFVLRQYNFAEVTGAMNEKGYVILRGSLFCKKEKGYQLLSSIDTVYVIRNFDVTKAMLSEGSFYLVSLIWRNLNEIPKSGQLLSYQDLFSLDSLEKTKLPLYKNESLKEGAYFNYESFKNQVPDKNVIVEYSSKGEIRGVSYINESGDQKKLKKNEIYALVDKGKITIVTDYGHYPMEKKGNDFYFIGRDKVNANSGDVIVASMFFGILGGLIASENSALFEMKLDHINGGFIRLKEVD